MQGMMEHMQGMIEHMQGMMGRMHGRKDRGGMMGRGGMMAAVDEDDEDMPQGDMMGMMSRGGMMGMMGRHGMMGHGHKMLRMLDRLAAQLELTDEQETQIRTLVRQHMKDAVQTRADIAIQRIDLQALLDADAPDLAKVQDTLQAIASQHADLMYAHIALMQEVKQLLTPEQQEQFRSLRRQMMHGRGGMMGMRGRGGKPGGMRHPCGMMGRDKGSQ